MNAMKIAAAAVTDSFASTASDDLQARVRAHMPTLDGLRGLAVMIVVWHNTASTGASVGHDAIGRVLSLFSNMGWMGVQLFFVLSGFLITGILLDAKGAPRQFRNFYMRRVLRIFPIYYAVLFVAFIVLPALGYLPEWSVANKSQQIWYWTYLANWELPIVGGGGGLSHFWSLAVEEQFYLLWPLVVIGLQRRALSWLCVGLIVSAPLARAVLINHDFEFAKWAAYEFTFVRWDALACGALLAIAVRYRPWLQVVMVAAPKAMLCALIYMAGYAALNHNFAAVEQGVAALNQSVAALLCAALLFRGIFSAQPTTSRWQVFLSNSMLRNIGKYSYAIYIFHFPIAVGLSLLWKQHFGDFQNAHPTLDNSLRVVVVALCAYLLAICSWHLLEQPCLKLKRFFINNKAQPALG
jgi:peptidoglycan/LPS O-acetylase OafA/YrhL